MNYNSDERSYRVFVLITTIAGFLSLATPAAAVEPLLLGSVRERPDQRQLVTEADLLYGSQVIRSEAAVSVQVPLVHQFYA